MYLIFDTETTGLPKNYQAPISQVDNWPRMVQLAWQVYNRLGELVEVKNYIIFPQGYDIPFNATKIHGITTQKAREEGHDIKIVLEEFNLDLQKSRFLVGHNIGFDVKIVGAELFRASFEYDLLLKKPLIDTKDISVDFCALPGGIGGKFKWPTLGELHRKLFDSDFLKAHNALADVQATARCFFELFRLGIVPIDTFGIDQDEFELFKKRHTKKIDPIGISIEEEQEEALSKAQILKKETKEPQNKVKEEELAKKFIHLHNHTSFSVLSSTMDVHELVEKAFNDGFYAVGISDYGNMMGVFSFLQAIENINRKKNLENTSSSLNNKPFKGIVGCELFISEHYLQKKFTKDNPDRRYKQVLLAKNKQGYFNLAYLSSQGYIEGYYSGYPRIDKELIKKHKEGLIALSGGLGSEIPYTILNYGEKKAEEVFCFWLDLFGDDFYIEFFRHNIEEENYVNEVLMGFAKKYKVKYIGQNNNFYLEKKDSAAHDILLCVKDGEKQSTPIGKGRGYRFGFSNQEFYFKSSYEMASIFSDLPESFTYLEELVDKIEIYELSQKVRLPKFDIPYQVDITLEGASSIEKENAYLKKLAYQGASHCYNEITLEIRQRLDFELDIIRKIGYPGYFLIVQDFIHAAKNMGVSVGPGRGSVAGSLVAYCIGITNIDPLKYDLLFERFLNPDRISLPDIDIDFDDRGREKIIQWVVDKYGKNQVAQIITYGKMAAKLAIRDVARVLELPLNQTDRLTKMVPLNSSLKKLFSHDINALKEHFNNDELEQIKAIKQIEKENTLEAKVLKQAEILEGSIRNTGIHACGIIITPLDVRELIPVAISKDSDLLLTQFDNSVVEEAGLLKMDFLGLKTLTILKDTLKLIKNTENKEINLDEISLEDEKTYKIFQEGNTIGVFQYESPGMQKHLRDLKPDKFEDLIAMNALYRPGPLQYIPNFIARKHGREAISYDFPQMESFLKSTYGITVYQEQVMLLAQEIAGFSKGEADVLRKAMGKKQKHILDKMKDRFIKGAIGKGYKKESLDKIWQDWEFFASYAFNKSHSTCYAYLAFQTAYLKAHYPSQYMACVLSNHMKNIKDISFFMEACKQMGIKVLGPDINESDFTFSVNHKGDVRFGMGAIKGVGEIAVESIINERQKGKYSSIFDLVKRVDLRIVNKKTIESLVLSGAFDSFEPIHRAQYFFQENGSSAIEKILRFGVKYQDFKKQFQVSLFDHKEIEMPNPQLNDCEPWPSLMTLSKEKEVVGIYITSHPLDEYPFEIKYFTNLSLDQLDKSQETLVGREFYICGMVSSFQEKISMKSGKKYGIFFLEDYKGNREFRLFGEEYIRYKNFLLYDNSFIHLKIRVKKGYSGDNWIEIIQIQLLEEAIEKLSREITIHIEIDKMKDDLINQLENLVCNHSGNKDLYFLIFDRDTKMHLKFISKKNKVDINKVFLKELELIPSISFNVK